MFLLLQLLLSSLLPVPTLATYVRFGQQPCTACQPNPIAMKYPSNVTGTINGTISVILVELSYARTIIPAEYPILNAAYTRFGIPATSYPIVIETGIDHDIQLHGIHAVDDFSSLRITYPFLDLLHDGASHFRYSPRIALPYSSAAAIAGAAAYGEKVTPAEFRPFDTGWLASPHGRVFFNAYLGPYARVLGDEPQFRLSMRPTDDVSPYGLAFYRNVTNQPIFAGNGLCDNMVRLWNSSVSRGEYAPRGMEGRVWFDRPFLEKKTGFSHVPGVRGDTAFIENNYIPCGQLKGYGGTGPGDSG